MLIPNTDHERPMGKDECAGAVNIERSLHPIKAESGSISTSVSSGTENDAKEIKLLLLLLLLLLFSLFTYRNFRFFSL